MDYAMSGRDLMARIRDAWIDWRVRRGIKRGDYDNPSTVYRRRQRMAARFDD